MESKNEILAKIDKTNEQISNSPIIKGLIDGGLSLIPFLGSAISSSLDTRAFQLFEENSRKFTEEVGRLVTNIDESKLDKKFLETPEFTSLLIETLPAMPGLMMKKRLIFSQKFLQVFQPIKDQKSISRKAL